MLLSNFYYYMTHRVKFTYFMYFSSPLQRTFSMRASKKGVGKRPIAAIGSKALTDAEENEKDVTVDKENNDFKRASTRKAKSARNPKKDSNIEAEEAIENRLSGSSAKDEVDVIADVANITNENGSKGCCLMI